MGILSIQIESRRTAAKPINDSIKQGIVPVRTTKSGPMGEISRILTAFALPLCITETEATTV